MIDGVLPVILIFIYLLIIYLFNYYINIKMNKITIDNDLNKNKIINLYSYNENNIKKLFWLTLLDLIDRKYFELYEKDNAMYIKKNQVDNLIFKNYESEVIKYICLFLEDNKISIDELDEKISSDCNFQNIEVTFMKLLKKDTVDEYGNIDRYNIFIGPFIISFLYFIQALYFLNVDLKFLDILIFSILLSFFSIVLAYILRNRIKKYSVIRYSILSVFCFIASIISTFLWQKFYNIDYLIFHITIALIVYMYYIFMINNINYMNVPIFYKNKRQKDLIIKMNRLRNKLIFDNKNEKYLIYSLEFQIYKNIPKKYKEFIIKFKI